jgi:hypothetical protein
MSGTGPMNELAIRTAVNLTVGLSKVPRMTFEWGKRANPVSVGLRGQWAVLADRLQDIHLYLGFDGQQLLVAPGGPGAVVLVNGQPLTGHAWVPVTVPAHIQVGDALLRVENEAALPGGAENPVNSSADTWFDGGVLRERGRALAQPAAVAPTVAAPMVLGGAGPRAVPLGATLQSAAVPEPAQAAPVANNGRPRSQPELPQAVNSLPSSPPVTSVTQPPAPAKKGAWAEASGPKKAILVLMPFALATMMWVLLDDSDQQLASPAPAAAAKPAGATPAGATPDPAPSQAPPRQRFSLAKTPASPDSAGAAPSAVAPPSSASPAPSSAALAAPSPAASPVAAPPSGASPRAALSAALLGNLDQAAELYTKLAAADPGNQAFSLAARLTAAHAVRRP